MGAREVAGAGSAGDGQARARRRMVDEQLAGRGIRDPRVLEAMGAVARHEFVDPAFVGRAYGDHALPTAEGQTISQPWIVARMLELARLEPHHRVLEIGTGSGYQTLLLARLAERVFSVERLASLLRVAQRRLDQLAVRNVALRHGDGSMGWPEFAPYDRIVVTAAAPHVPEALRQQLAADGRLVIPVGSQESQTLEVWCKDTAERWTTEHCGECRFVPLVGRDAWP